MTQRPALATTSPDTPSEHGRQLSWALRALCLTEIVSWGVLYYAFPVLARDITSDTGWSTTTITAVFSAALVVSAAAGIAVGRMMHRHGPRWLMTGGSVVAVVAVVLIALAPSLWLFVAGWVLAGIAMSCVLYAPAFSAVTVWFGADRVPALTAITLVAGLASTVFAPLTAALNDHLSWRGTYLALAGVLAVLTIPVHALALRPRWPHLDVIDGGTQPVDTRPVNRREFWALIAGFTAMSLCSYAVVINLVPLLTARGYSATQAALALGVGGIGQVLGRLCYARLSRRATLVARTYAVFGLIALTTAAFGVLTGPYLLLVAVGFVAGNARGLSTLLSATAVSERWGTTRYARLNGVFNAPLMAASAIAPFAGSALAALLGGYPAAFELLACLGLVGALLAGRRTSTA
jgi:MFS family permease